MSGGLLENNQGFLQELKEGSFPEGEIDETFGSFCMCLFKEENQDCIPLFFEFLSWYTGEDYSNESEWVQESLKKAQSNYEKFEEMIEDNPLLKLLIALSD